MIVAFPIAAETAEGNVIIDITKAFSSDIELATARPFAALSGITPAAVDPQRSYVERVRLTERSLNIRSHLTFIGVMAANPTYGPQPASLTVGHSFVFLPDTPMRKRFFDRRVGYFDSPMQEFESATGNAQLDRRVIHRFRLEKANPNAAVSDPVKPIVYYLGPGIPARWRPYLKAGIEMWNPAFRAAGFSNAIRVLDAPTPEQDPNWYAEDVSINVVRWLPQSRVNALGPHVFDPRSGETISAHMLIWPSVVDYFSRYYHSLFSALDPDAATLPLPEKKMGELYTVAQMRDPKFANLHGPNSSIMAYGRFNQAAQPGDGVTVFKCGIGSYDFAGINWGYGDFDNDPQALEALAASFDRDRRLTWAAGELPDEQATHGFDPPVLTENTGADRIEATKLGIANVQRSLNRLDSATQGNSTEFNAAFDVYIGTHTRFLNSVAKLIAGVMPRAGARGAKLTDLVPPSEQSRAVAYLLGEGARSLDIYRNPEMLERITPVGGPLLVDASQQGLVAELLKGPYLALLEQQSMADGAAYSPSRLGQDVGDAVWGDLKSTAPWQRAIQRGYVAQTTRLLENWAKASTLEPAVINALTQAKYPGAAARLNAETGDDTTYPAWLRGYLPSLKSRLDEAARSATNPSDQLYFRGMAAQIEKLARAAQ